jgi:hypothetical protein
MRFLNLSWLEAKCIFCFRRTSTRYCHFHETARSLLRSHYRNWLNAYGIISWNEFLLHLRKVDQKGKWIADAIEVELNNSKIGQKNL